MYRQLFSVYFFLYFELTSATISSEKFVLYADNAKMLLDLVHTSENVNSAVQCMSECNKHTKCQSATYIAKESRCELSRYNDWHCQHHMMTTPGSRIYFKTSNNFRKYSICVLSFYLFNILDASTGFQYVL